jgi:hypothetical protein
MTRSFHTGASGFRSIDKFGIWRVVGVDDQQFFFSASQEAINLDLAILDSNDCTRSGIQNLVLVSTSVTKDNNNLILVI